MPWRTACNGVYCEFGLSSENYPTAGFAMIVAVLGDANLLTARRSTGARSALNLHTFRGNGP
jgi:hypothetical protein